MTVISGSITRYVFYARISVSGEAPERFLNGCAVNNIIFRDARRSGRTITCSVPGVRLCRARELASSMGLAASVVRSSALARLFRFVRRRYVLAALLVLSGALTAASNALVLRINIVESAGVSPERLLQALRREGVTIGAKSSDISIRRLKPRLILAIPELSWITVNMHGSTANVYAARRIPAPEVADENYICDVRASRPGIIDRMDVYAGSPRCSVGDTVAEGDVLISSQMESPFAGLWYVRAAGSVICDTWYRAEMKIPLTVSSKEYTGNEKTVYSVIFAGKRINLSFLSGISYAFYDRIQAEKQLYFPSSGVLPFTLCRTVCREYEPVSAGADEAAALAASKAALEASLADSLAPGGEILDVRWESGESGGVLCVIMYAHCREDVAQ